MMKLAKLLIGILGLSFSLKILPSAAESVDYPHFSPEHQPYLLTQHLSMTEQKILKAHRQLGFRLFSAMVKETPQDNILISPTSVAIALSLLYNGASGLTQEEMNQVLGFQGMTLKEINQGHQQLQKNFIQSGKTVQLSLANSLWARQGFAFRHPFLRNNREYYQAEITNLNFTSPQSVGIINRWVWQQTQGKISQVIDKIQSDDVLFLINTLYFKGLWQLSFNPELTQNEPFYLANGMSKPHPLMTQQGKFLYQETSLFQAVSLPYENSHWRFYVFLPKKEKNLSIFFNSLNETNWNQWVNHFEMKEGILQLPRFRLEEDREMSSILKTLGMKSAFTQGTANFTQMTSQPVVIDRIKHSTFIEVNEEGTEAAATTSVGIAATSAKPPQDTFEMIVNRPFFYAIVDQKSGMVLLMGTFQE